jgi:Zn-dependent protease/predicted transcriptional regulator
MRTWSIPAGRIFGVEFRIHFLFLLLFPFLSFSEQRAHINSSPDRLAALAGILLVSAVIHEIGHAVVEKFANAPPRAVVLFPIGGVTIFDEAQPEVAPDWRRDVRIALAGPAMSLFVAGVSAVAALIFVPQAKLWPDPALSSTNLPHAAVWANLWLAGINLLPAYPLDGGQVLRTVLSRKMGTPAAMRRAVSLGRGFAAAFFLAGIWNSWFLLIGAFLFVAAQIEERSAVFHSVLETVRLEDIMLTDFATLSPADTLEDALEKAVHCLQDDFPVIRGGDMVGVVSKHNILQTLRSEGNGYVQSVMSRVFDVAVQSESLAAAFRKLRARNSSILPVVHEQQLVGIVTLQNLMHSMALLAETRKLRSTALEP